MRVITAMLAVVALATGVGAHSVPIAPSTCTFDSLELSVPELGLVADVAPATDADAMRVVYDASTRTAQVTAVETRARPFMLDGHTGTLGFPLAFQTELLASGDLSFPFVGVSLTLDGDTRLAPLTLTTALLASQGLVAEGAPIGADGRVTLVGAIPPGLVPPPLDAVTTLVRASCVLTPAPDLDQFVPVFEPTKLRLVMRESGGRLRVVLRGGAPEMDAYPLQVRVRADGIPVVTIDLPSGLAPDGPRRFTGQLPDGTTIQVRTKVRGVPKHLMLVNLPGGPLPSGLAASGAVDATYELGGLITRDGASYRIQGATFQAKR
jgi:hypothetical protein